MKRDSGKIAPKWFSNQALSQATMTSVPPDAFSNHHWSRDPLEAFRALILENYRDSDHT
jgi:hypothetical protein